jgi:hypothetical protein
LMVVILLFSLLLSSRQRLKATSSDYWVGIGNHHQACRHCCKSQTQWR